MTPLYFGHATLVSSIGRGKQAHLAALQERQSGLRPCDFEGRRLPTYMGMVEGLEKVSLKSSLSHFTCRNNQLALLGLQQDGFESQIAEARRQYGAQRIGVLIGTSTSGILETEHAYQQTDPKTGSIVENVFLTGSNYAKKAVKLEDLKNPDKYKKIEQHNLCFAI